MFSERLVVSNGLIMKMFHFYTPENLGFSDVFGGYRGRTLVKIKRKNLEKYIKLKWACAHYLLQYNQNFYLLQSEKPDADSKGENINRRGVFRTLSNA